MNKIAAGEGASKSKKTTHISPEIGASFDLEIGEGSVETSVSPTQTKHLGFGVLWKKDKKGLKRFGGVALHFGVGIGLDLIPFDISGTVSESD